jgi:hypothetical protein
VRGLELSRRLWAEAVAPILARRFPELDAAAALIGYGSEVLGFDDDVSQDHHWGARLFLFVRGEDLGRAEAIGETLAAELPLEIGRVPTNFAPPTEDGSRMPQAIAQGPVAHRVEVHTVGAFMRSELGFDPLQGVAVTDWLVTPSQKLLRVTAGEVFADPIGELTDARARLAWYPHDVWLQVMAGEWRRIAQFEHLHGRAGSRGDEIGSRLIAARLIEPIMRLAFLQARRYAPYPKWFGSAYELLDRPERSALEAALAASNWREREAALVEAYELLARAHNALGVTEPVDPEPRQFFGRGFRIIGGDRFVAALREAIADPEVLRIEHEAGAIDSVSTNVDLLTRPWLWERVRSLYTE